MSGFYHRSGTGRAPGWYGGRVCTIEVRLMGPCHRLEAVRSALGGAKLTDLNIRDSTDNDNKAGTKHNTNYAVDNTDYDADTEDYAIDHTDYDADTEDYDADTEDYEVDNVSDSDETQPWYDSDETQPWHDTDRKEDCGETTHTDVDRTLIDYTTDSDETPFLDSDEATKHMKTHLDRDNTQKVNDETCVDSDETPYLDSDETPYLDSDETHLDSDAYIYDHDTQPYPTTSFHLDS